jgi:hypothetical protein
MRTRFARETAIEKDYCFVLLVFMEGKDTLVAMRKEACNFRACKSCCIFFFLFLTRHVFVKKYLGRPKVFGGDGSV